VKKKRILTLLLPGVGLIFVIFQISFALRISQLGFYLDVPPGERKKFSLRVGSDEAGVTVFNVSLIDWDRNLKGENRWFEKNTLSRSCAGWISISPAQFQLKKGEVKEITFVIDVPQDAQGTYWTAIYIKPSRATSFQEGTAIQTYIEFKVKIYETPPGTEEKRGKVTGMELLGINPLRMNIIFQNTGNVYLKPQGRIEIRDTTGKIVKKIPIPEFPVLPGARRLLEVSEEEGDFLPPGQYLALGIIDYGGDILVAGQLIFKVEGRSK